MRAFPYQRVDPPPAKNQDTVYSKQGGVMRETEAGLITALPSVAGRQGGSVTDWASGGSTNRTITGPVAMQVGQYAAVTASVSVAFPVAFQYAPLVFLQIIHGSAEGAALVRSITTSGFDFDLCDMAGDPLTSAGVMWWAIGPIA